MKFDDFVRKLSNDPDLLFQVVQASWRAQRKIRGQLKDGSMVQSRAEYEELMRFFDGVEDPEIYRSRHPDNE